MAPRGRLRVAWVPDWQSTVLEAERAGQAEDPDGCDHFYVSVDVGECRGLRVERSVAADTLRAVVPRSCLGDPRAVRVGASTSAYQDPGDDTYLIFSDRWAPTDRDRGWFVYGPWVRSAR